MPNDDLILAMTEFDRGNAALIQHFLKVFQFAHTIGVQEGLSPAQLKILDAAAILHDIGILPSQKKYGSGAGKYQEEQGPIYAKPMLEQQGDFSPAEIDRICFLIGHHHTYTGVDGMDYRILLEADFLVNSFEGKLPEEKVIAGRNNFFETKTGKLLLNTMFDLNA